MTQLLWARHGENVANLSRTFSHRVFDGDLTERGRAQAERLGQLLASAGSPIGLIAVSPLKRAVQTAEIVGGHLGLEPELTLDDLREVNVGDLDGRNDDAAWATYDRILESWRRGRIHERFPTGEDLIDLETRLRRALVHVVSKAEGRLPLVVAHGANIRAALPRLAQVPDPGVDLATGGIARFTVEADHHGSRIALNSWA